MAYIKNTHNFRGFKLTFADWFKFRLIEELTYEIHVWFQEKILNNDALCLILSSASRAKIFGKVIFLRQLHFHIDYLFIG
jgi:hypothetical protein